MSKTGKTLLIIGGLLFAVFLVAIIGFALMAESLGKPSVPENSVLVLEISGELPDHSPKEPMAELFGISRQKSFSNLITQLRKAKVDSRVGAVLLDISFPQIGWGKADELRAAIKDFRTSGKPIYSYMQIGFTKDYYIASAAEKVFLPPAGDLYVNGFAAQAMFYRGALDKLGIEPEFIKIGKYKNAPDQYTRKEMSDAQREVINAILDEYFERLKTTIAEERGKSAEDVEALIDGAPYHATEAQKVGLIDGASYLKSVYDDLKDRLGYKADDELRTVNGRSYEEVSPSSLNLNNGEKVAVIYASGAINLGNSNRSPFGGETSGSDTIVDAVNEAAEDSSVKAIVLRVNSPGGSALASDLMWNALEEAKAKKPVVVSMGDYAASGGYYIACNANKIVAERSTVTGSIGVFMGKPNIKGMYDWIGFSNEYILRGKNAGIFRETESWTESERAKMEQQTQNIYYTDFVPKVAKGRNMTTEQVDEIGQGRVWTGTQGKEKGLVDEFGGMEKAIEIAKDLAEIPADKEVTRVAYPKPRSLFSTIFGGGYSEMRERKTQETLAKSLPEDARRALRYAELFDRMKSGEAMMIMPFELTFK